MRNIQIAPDEYYHIFNRGNNKQNIFLGNKDWIRFLFLILHFQSPVNFFQIDRLASSYVQHRVLDNKQKEITKKIIDTRYVELVTFTLMPNHFHLIVNEFQEEGISRYMQRILNSYTKYSNTKYEKSGHLFQGPYQIVHIKNNEQLLRLSAYIHRNPREIKEWKDKEHLFPWSSYQDYIKENRWGELLKHQIITEQFSSPEDYKNFVETSGTKLQLDEEHLI